MRNVFIMSMMSENVGVSVMPVAGIGSQQFQHSCECLHVCTALQLGDPVLALHPSFVNSYAPGKQGLGRGGKQGWGGGGKQGLGRGR